MPLARKFHKSRDQRVLSTVVDTVPAEPVSSRALTPPVDGTEGLPPVSPPGRSLPEDTLCSSQHQQASGPEELGGSIPLRPRPSSGSTPRVFSAVTQRSEQDLSPGRPWQSPAH